MCSECHSKKWVQNFIGALICVSYVPLQFVRKLKVKAEQHIMRLVPFHFITPIFLFVVPIMYSVSDGFTFLIKT